jgi:hypothetical protein
MAAITPVGRSYLPGLDQERRNRWAIFVIEWQIHLGMIAAANHLAI